MRTYSLEKVNHFNLQKQHLTDESKSEDIIKITDDIFGLHATGATIPFLSLFSRMNNFSKDILINELTDKKTLARIRSVRRTVYIIPKKMIPIVYAATKKMIEDISERYTKTFGVTFNDYDKISKKILNIIGERGLTTKEIKEELDIKTNISPIVNLMCDQGLLVRGFSKKGWKSTIHTYYKFNEFFPDIDLNFYNEKEAQEIVIRKYITVFGPITLKDIIWWTGFPVINVKKIINKFKDELSDVKIEKNKDEFIIFKEEEKKLSGQIIPKQPVINILPILDPYIMGYKDRGRYLDQLNYYYIFDKSGNATNTILLNGQIIGVWDIDDPYVKMFFLNKIDGQIKDIISDKLIKIGKFYTDKKLKLKECKKMISLKERTAGSMMKPLKP
jgi:hypothetical protein